MRLAVLDSGTYCDFTLSYAVVKALLKEGHTIVLVTDKDNKVAQPMQGLDIVRYESVSKELNEDSNIVNMMAATSVRMENKMGHGWNFFSWINGDMHNFMTSVMPKVDGLVFHYPALTYMAAIPEDVLSSKHICVYYVAPGYPNIDAPWVFSLRLKDRNFLLRTEDPHQQYLNYNSPKVIWKHSSMLTLWNNKLIENMMKKALIVSAWDPVYLPPTRPSQSDPTEFNVVHAGAIVDVERMNTDFEKQVLEAPKAFVATASGNVVYISLGSFDIGDKADQLVVALLGAFPDVKLFFHDTKKLQKDDGYLRSLEKETPDRLLVWKDSVPHEWIVPKCKFIVTSGSICVVNIALYHAVPLIIVPMLTEQFFWGLNYSQQTGVPYVDVKDASMSIDQQVRNAARALQSPVVATFHDNVRKSVRATDGAMLLAQHISRSIMDRTRRKFREGECKDMKDAMRRVGAEILRRNPSANIRDLPALWIPIEK